MDGGNDGTERGPDGQSHARASRSDVDAAIRKTVAVVLAGGRGKRLHELTEVDAKPGLDFAGKYRIIDFTLSNCVHSGIRRIGVLTQYNSHRLLEHLQSGWTFLPAKLGEFIHVWPAQQSLERSEWYAGTADAVFRNLDHLRSFDAEHVLILAGDHVYKMDYSRFVEDHIANDADLSVACVEVPRESATGFGIARVDESERIVSFVEKPSDPPSIPGRPSVALASMGIYLCRASFLFDQLARDAHDARSAHDFGIDLIPYLVPRARVFAHRFERSCIGSDASTAPYWRDVGTLDAYFESNLDLTLTTPALNLYDTSWPVFTHRDEMAPAKFVHDQAGRVGTAIESIVSSGCIVSGATVRNSVLFSNVRVHSYASLDHVVALPDVDVGRHARIRRAIIARGCRIPPGLVVGEDAAADAARFHRTPGGVTLIASSMLDRL